MKTYIVYNMQGYDSYDQEKDLFMGVITINVIAETEEEAFARAKKNHPSKEKFRCIGSTEYEQKNDNS